MRLSVIVFLFLLSCSPVKKGKDSFIRFRVNLLDRSDDTFKVTVYPKLSISKKTIVYNFAATAPGAYQTMNIGRFVKVFKAYDRSNNELAVSRESVNKWQVKNAESLSRIYYEISETWDTKVDSFYVYEMCGTSIENDHSLINGQAVFGYFDGFQKKPVELIINKPDQWKEGSSLRKNTDGAYLAKSYNELVDSPILLGRLSHKKSVINGTEIDVYTYSKNDIVQSSQILKSMQDMLVAADQFMGSLPVKNYTFLFHFEDKTVGAWEHSYSSEYIWEESEYDEMLARDIVSVAAHEFFHILTPLNVHSELIANFNFEKPNASKHLWLYEGVTEWASHIMLLRAGQISLEEYLDRLAMKYVYSSFYDENVSLVDLSLMCFTEEGQKQFGNIYQKGALVAGLLDLKLLEESSGKKGLRELMIDLSGEYGINKPFSEDQFFEALAGISRSNLKNFIDSYINGTQSLKIDSFYQMIGIRFHQEYQSDVPVNEMGIDLDFDKAGFKIADIKKPLINSGLQVGDYVLAINGKRFRVDTADEILDELLDAELGAPYTVLIKRDDKKKLIKLRLLKEYARFTNIFLEDKNPNNQSINLKKQWLKNLDYE